MLRNARSLLSKSILTHRFPRPICRPLHRVPSRPPTPTVSHRSVVRFPIAGQLGKRAGNDRGISTDHSREVDEINLKFAEAREEIEAALESKETVYFDEEAECAREAVKVVLDMFDELLRKVHDKDRSALQRSMGLKIEQLKAELKQLDD